ncbi:MAG: polyphenol oxidase family protein [Candidatus Babeliales bacterium]
MIYHAEGLFQIAFGNASFSFNPKKIKEKNLLQQIPFEKLNPIMKLRHLVFLHQIHGKDGLALKSLPQVRTIKPFSIDGDFLVTQLSHVGLAIATADCLPIILFCPRTLTVALIHAGWRGAVQKVAAAALEYMERLYQVNPTQVRVFFGPSAKSCCYAVGSEVIDSLNAFSYKDDVLKTRGTETFFDLPRFNMIQLQDAGIPIASCNTTYNICTICDPSFCSYRRDKNVQRQMTVVALR